MDVDASGAGQQKIKKAWHLMTRTEQEKLSELLHEVERLRSENRILKEALDICEDALLNFNWDYFLKNHAVGISVWMDVGDWTDFKSAKEAVQRAREALARVGKEGL